MSKVKFNLYSQELLAHLFLGALGNVDNPEAEKVMTLVRQSPPGDNAVELEMCLLINNEIKLPLGKVVAEWEKQIDSWVEAAAKEKIENLTGDMFQCLSESVEDVKNKLYKIVGIEKEEDEY